MSKLSATTVLALPGLRSLATVAEMCEEKQQILHGRRVGGGCA